MLRNDKLQDRPLWDRSLSKTDVCALAAAAEDLHSVKIPVTGIGSFSSCIVKHPSWNTVRAYVRQFMGPVDR